MPGKNIAVVGGIPCLGRIILACRDAMEDSPAEYTIFCSTNSLKFKAVAESYGAYVPFLRPQQLATSEASTIDVVRHVLAELRSSWDAVITLQCTVPFTNGSDIKLALETFNSATNGTLVSVKHACPQGWVFGFDSSTKLMTARESVPYQRQQSLTSNVELNGSIYIATPDHLLKHSYIGDFNTVAFLMPESRSVDIDEPFDLELCRAIADVKIRERDSKMVTDLVLCIDISLSTLGVKYQELLTEAKCQGYTGIRILIDGESILKFPSACNTIFPMAKSVGLELHCNYIADLNSQNMKFVSCLAIKYSEIDYRQLKLLDRKLNILLSVSPLEVSTCVLAMRSIGRLGFKSVRLMIRFMHDVDDTKQKYTLLKLLKGALDGCVGITDTTTTAFLATIMGTCNVNIYEKYIRIQRNTIDLDPSMSAQKFLLAKSIVGVC